MTGAPSPQISVRGRIEGLDGVRTVLHWLVVLTHLSLISQSLGWMAMQTFFLLSGFLILRVILDLKLQFGAGRYFGEFASFRVLRILPAYYAYLALLFAGMYCFDREGFQQLRSSAPGLFLFYFNYAWIGADVVRSPWTGHLWSLSVEEQFYLLWPLLVWITPLARLPRVLMTMILLGPLLRYGVYRLLGPAAHAHGYAPAAAVYVAMPTYLDAFALGGLLCFDDLRRRLAAVSGRNYAIAIVAALIAGYAWNAWATGFDRLDWSALGYPITMPARGQFLWGYSVTGVLLTIFLAKVVEGRLAHRFLTIPVVDRVGTVTYSLYLVHHGLILLVIGAMAFLGARSGHPQLAQGLTLPMYAVALYSIAFLAYRWIEQPAMRLRQRLFPRRSTGAPAAAP